MKVFILLGIVAVALASKTSEVCGENEQYNGCGTDCPLTCENYRNPPQICNEMCKIGCECKEGFVRSRDRRCVRPINCPVDEVPTSDVCGENERYNECGTDCPLTCENYSNPPRACNFMCRIGCECEEGFVRSRDGRCVKPINCPVDDAPKEVCGRNQRYTDCGTSCPLTCENYRNPPQICNLMCNIGCECEEGYVRSIDGLCVRPFQCPQNATAEKTCLGKPDAGMCFGYFPKFHYDPQTGTCKKFIYGGCGGNGNRYDTEEECLNSCGDIRPRLATPMCLLPAETGLCRGAFPRYYFDKRTNQCQKFIYGGCGGNENNFETEEECNRWCGVLDSANVCELPAETGPCRANMSRYFYDKTSGTCRLFSYGGCKGNGNNFRTVDDCEKTCA